MMASNRGLAPGLNLVHAFASKFRRVGDGSHAARLGSMVDGLDHFLGILVNQDLRQIFTNHLVTVEIIGRV